MGTENEENGTGSGETGGGAGSGEAISAGRKPEGNEAPKEWKIEDLPPDAQAFLRKQIADAEAKTRATSKERAAKEERERLLSEFAEKLGLKPGDEKPDADKLAAQLAATQVAAREARIERDLTRIAGKAGADADAMLDSKTFMAKLHKLDADADDYADKLAALVKTEAEGNPRFRVAQVQPAATGAGAEFGGNGGRLDPSDLDVEGMRELLYGKRRT